MLSILSAYSLRDLNESGRQLLVFEQKNEAIQKNVFTALLSRRGCFTFPVRQPRDEFDWLSEPSIGFLCYFLLVEAVIDAI
jgi:hypothetical protein